MKIVEYVFEEKSVDLFKDLISQLYPEDSYTALKKGSIFHLLNSGNPFFRSAQIKNFLVYQDENQEEIYLKECSQCSQIFEMYKAWCKF